ncbi:MAG: ATP-binding cassette domain-containing protein [Bacteroidales bacterium]|nr:ATP-binding cassette domain-containing protein [Bacteroidales bacterium]
MSERILKALMQLFAIVADPNSNADERRDVVRSFLLQQLNSELIEGYLRVFDEFFDEYQRRRGRSTRKKQQLAASSVKVIMIATVINEELSQKEKIIVLIRLLEFIKTDETISEQENEFVTTISDTFNIPRWQFDEIQSFVVNSFSKLSDSENILIIDSNILFPQLKIKKFQVENLKGQIRVLRITTGNLYIMRFISENEIYLNSQLLQPSKVFMLSTGSSIRSSHIKPIYYSEIVGSFALDITKPKIVLEAINVQHRFKGGNIGLQNINFLEKSGNLIGIMGASGTGKSTLLNVLNGMEKPSKGEVVINGINIHKEADKIEGIIGFVSQDDLLIEDLTVFENLFFNAQLCFSDLSRFQILRLVLKTLKSLGLYEAKDLKVGTPLDKKISGGQRKRLNIALELIREPAVLFLDEPTSGLSSRDSQNILDLLKELALKGKMVYVVIHQPSSDIFKMFDRLLILDQGGYLIYNGDPVDSIVYFKSRIHQANWNESECNSCGNVNVEQLFNIIEANVIDEYGSFTQTRKTSPPEWHNYFKEYKSKEKKRSVLVRDLPELSFKVPKWFRQLKVFIQRDVLSKLANRQYMIINLLEAPILAFLLSYIIKYYSVDVITNTYGYTMGDNMNLPVYLFMSVIIALFIGLTVSAQEIIKDQRILRRERFLNLSRSSYLMSKISILFVISAYQSLVYVLVGNSIMEIRGMYLEYWLMLFSTWAFANLLGLNISDSFKTSVTIHILIPFLIIPQLILSGIIVKYDNLNPNISEPSSIPWYGELITARWAYEGLAVYQFTNNEYEQLFYKYNKQMSQAEYKKNYWLKTLENKVNEIKRNFADSSKQDILESNIELLRNEIIKELEFNYSKKLDPSKITIENYSPEVEQSIKTYFKLLKKQYIKLNNEARRKKDNIVNQRELTPESKEQFVLLKKRHYNIRLANSLTNSDDIRNVIEFNGELYQKSDPIYQDADTKFIRAHFYSPLKQLFGYSIHTFWMNIIIVWFSLITLYISLYYSWFKTALNFTGYLYGRIKEKFNL